MTAPESPKIATDDKVSVKEAADMLSVTSGRVSQMCSDGKLDYEGKGKKRRISHLSVVAFLASRKKHEMEGKVEKAGRDAIKDVKDIERDSDRIMNKHR